MGQSALWLEQEGEESQAQLGRPPPTPSACRRARHWLKGDPPPLQHRVTVRVALVTWGCSLLSLSIRKRGSRVRAP